MRRLKFQIMSEAYINVLAGRGIMKSHIFFVIKKTQSITCVSKTDFHIKYESKKRPCTAVIRDEAIGGFSSYEEVFPRQECYT